MDLKKKKRLEADGWTVGSVEDLLDLSPLQLAYVDLTIYLGEEIKGLRKINGLTQTALANLMGSSQSRVAKLEKGDPSVSFDLMLRAFLHLGVPPKMLGLLILNYDEPIEQEWLNWKYPLEGEDKEKIVDLVARYYLSRLPQRGLQYSANLVLDKEEQQSIVAEKEKPVNTEKIDIER
jgi:transcriptional regulator with XRE-family HTH domain